MVLKIDIHRGTSKDESLSSLKKKQKNKAKQRKYCLAYLIHFVDYYITVDVCDHSLWNMEFRCNEKVQMR